MKKVILPLNRPPDKGRGPAVEHQFHPDPDEEGQFMVLKEGAFGSVATAPAIQLASASAQR